MDELGTEGQTWDAMGSAPFPVCKHRYSVGTIAGNVGRKKKWTMPAHRFPPPFGLDGPE